jgi:transcription-repair coupling factor (superfamily II helicase)
MNDGVWEGLSRALRTSAPFRSLSEGARVAVRLPAAAAAWVAELLAAELSAVGEGRTVLALVPGEMDAQAWLEAATMFGDALPQRRARGEVVYFPAPSLSPYQETDASLMVRAQEAAALDAVVSGHARTVVATPRALFRLLPSAATLRAHTRHLRPNEEHPLEELAEHLTRHGYRRCDLVSEVGDFAVRGGVFDLFTPGYELPLRLDLFGDTVESIRTFDPDSQRSQEGLDECRILPLSPLPAGADEAEQLAERLTERMEEVYGTTLPQQVSERIEQLRARGTFAGWESFLPWLAGAATQLPELIDDPLVVTLQPAKLASEVAQHAERLWEEFTARRENRRLALAPELLEHDAEAVVSVLEKARLAIAELAASQSGSRVGGGEAIDFAGSLTDLLQGQLPRFPREVETARARGDRCLLVVSPTHRRRMEELLEGREVPLGAGGVELVEGELRRGFRLPAAGVAIYGEQQILPAAAPMQRRKSVRFGPFVSGLRDLRVGDFVVHSDHGIARFSGLREVGGDGGRRERLPSTLQEMVPADQAVEVMELSYAGGKTLLVPLDRLDLIQKYSGIEGVAPRLDKLGGTSWNKTKARVKKGLRDMADELLKLYALRQLARAPELPPDSDLQRQFEASFAYEETPDQLDAIAAIKQDLEREQPMDRLLCGDVGYGKTEVAMRAAFKTVDSGYQVAVLAPTTILADQHLETFRRRFEGFPVSIEMISRFRSPAEVRAIRDRLAAGKLDILIGTHRLLSKDIEMPALGLMIVDEEQRFGVAQKERLKQFKRDVHVLAMSATPVPRTLQMSLAGVRDMSVIETPPKDRMAVETAILPFNSELVREAIEHEMERGGQVYYVYNRVESIERMVTYLRETVPGVRVTVGHGQLDEKELARRMHAFTAGEYDVLLATTIIENGIDIPNVNTMIVHRADRFGLAQLYQLRGRVGRSNQLAYCYLLVEGDRVLSETARKRLAAIREFTDLGAGFRIAARDLEIRGAGNLLGAEQSGHLNAVGLETYLKMLEEAVREARGETIEEEAPSTAIDLPVPMSIPAEYITDANLRMEIYRKIAAPAAVAVGSDGASSDDALLAELADRFGPPPATVLTLLQVAALKRLAERLRVQSISAKRRELVIRLRRDARVDVERLIEIVSERPGAAFSPSGVLTLPASGAAEMIEIATATLRELAAEPPSTEPHTTEPPSGHTAPAPLPKLASAAGGIA